MTRKRQSENTNLNAGCLIEMSKNSTVGSDGLVCTHSNQAIPEPDIPSVFAPWIPITPRQSQLTDRAVLVSLALKARSYAMASSLSAGTALKAYIDLPRDGFALFAHEPVFDENTLTHINQLAEYKTPKVVPDSLQKQIDESTYTTHYTGDHPNNEQDATEIKPVIELPSQSTIKQHNGHFNPQIDPPINILQKNFKKRINLVKAKIDSNLKHGVRAPGSMITRAIHEDARMQRAEQVLELLERKRKLYREQKWNEVSAHALESRKRLDLLHHRTDLTVNAHTPIAKTRQHNTSNSVGYNPIPQEWKLARWYQKVSKEKHGQIFDCIDEDFVSGKMHSKASAFVKDNKSVWKESHITSPLKQHSSIHNDEPQPIKPKNQFARGRLMSNFNTAKSIPPLNALRMQIATSDAANKFWSERVQDTHRDKSSAQNRTDSLLQMASLVVRYKNQSARLLDKVAQSELMEQASFDKPQKNEDIPLSAKNICPLVDVAVQSQDRMPSMALNNTTETLNKAKCDQNFESHLNSSNSDTSEMNSSFASSFSSIHGASQIPVESKNAWRLKPDTEETRELEHISQSIIRQSRRSSIIQTPAMKDKVIPLSTWKTDFESIHESDLDELDTKSTENGTSNYSDDGYISPHFNAPVFKPTDSTLQSLHNSCSASKDFKTSITRHLISTHDIHSSIDLMQSQRADTILQSNLASLDNLESQADGAKKLEFNDLACSNISTESRQSLKSSINLNDLKGISDMHAVDQAKKSNVSTLYCNEKHTGLSLAEQLFSLNPDMSAFNPDPFQNNASSSVTLPKEPNINRVNTGILLHRPDSRLSSSDVLDIKLQSQKPPRRLIPLRMSDLTEVEEMAATPANHTSPAFWEPKISTSGILSEK
ncbi:hypothetical protein QVD99_006148 [Batrachochytrium dendrobatidis]|nr:hypothetical protein QVD99_006148 [Batrachochytrium dendrobatidis]